MSNLNLVQWGSFSDVPLLGLMIAPMTAAFNSSSTGCSPGRSCLGQLFLSSLSFAKRLSETMKRNFSRASLKYDGFSRCSRIPSHSEQL